MVLELSQPFPKIGKRKKLLALIPYQQVIKFHPPSYILPMDKRGQPTGWNMPRARTKEVTGVLEGQGFSSAEEQGFPWGQNISG